MTIHDLPKWFVIVKTISNLSRYLHRRLPLRHRYLWSLLFTFASPQASQFSDHGWLLLRRYTCIIGEWRSFFAIWMERNEHINDTYSFLYVSLRGTCVTLATKSVLNVDRVVRHTFICICIWYRPQGHGLVWQYRAYFSHLPRFTQDIISCFQPERLPHFYDNS